MTLTITSQSDLEKHFAAIEDSTSRAISAIAKATSSTEALRQMKFEKIGFHPIEKRPLNIIEQVNQTFTYLVALKATAWLLQRHPDAGGFRLAPGAAATLPLDIMSIRRDFVGAETFAAVDPRNNRKLNTDLRKLSNMKLRYRYAFF